MLSISCFVQYNRLLVSNEKGDNEFFDNLPVVIGDVNEGKNERKERIERLSLPDEHLERRRRNWVIRGVR